MTDVDTSGEAVERLAQLCCDWTTHIDPDNIRSDCAATLRALVAERDRMRSAWLRVIQTENSCAATGTPCRPKRCGCEEEQNLLLQEP